jgi:glycine/D-amino acid oxidase-like deaminating enzyme
VDAHLRSPWLPSLWLPSPPPRRPPLPGDRDADVAIVGAGYTGLWTAYYLARADPGLRIAVLEAQFAGYGASGRNGGWCSALFPVELPGMAAALRSTVDEVGRVAAAEGIDCDFAKGGTISLARNGPQLDRARGPSLLDGTAAREICNASGVLGGTYSPDCAALHPAKLVRGLASTVERYGVVIYESTPVVSLAPGLVRTPHGRVRSPVVVLATEAYTARLPGLRRVLAPVYSSMIATEPLPDRVWDEIGLARRETFTDHGYVVSYGQRTADGRLAFGGRGAPYHYGSRVHPSYDRVPAVFAALASTLRELFPVVGRARIEYAWSGPLGVPRDWTPSVGLTDGVGWAGGYVGDGVAASNLAGRTLASLVAGADDELTRLPWVGHRSPRWEPEPLRWLGVNTARRLAAGADAAEQRTGRPARRAGVLRRLVSS